MLKSQTCLLEVGDHGGDVVSNEKYGFMVAIAVM
jgi:hypothetical protein